ncbi:MAG: hypothetical protein ACLFM1_09755 [Bacteroidales bacterium]
MSAKRQNGLGIAGFILALIGAVMFWTPVVGILFLGLGFLFSLISLIVGIASGRQIGFSIAGLLISLVFLALAGGITYSLFSLGF